MLAHALASNEGAYYAWLEPFTKVVHLGAIILLHFYSFIYRVRQAQHRATDLGFRSAISVTPPFKSRSGEVKHPLARAPSRMFSSEVGKYIELEASEVDLEENEEGISR